ncbi:MAG: GNAT family N-acetyltransferase [Clostridium sp.]|uniref:GNAT family N-acetyltransferase n=1 Tax=Clostridium sp. TaxID=1506 RepID=UPI002A89FDA0|nr:GNAT family N-acetyltransferase [Clostridium sp.]MDY5096947.1 GNAT family N-acetyltransferase [Clostridium sp.]
MSEIVIDDEYELENGIKLQIKETSVEDTPKVLEFLEAIKDESRIFMALSQGLDLEDDKIRKYIKDTAYEKNNIGLIALEHGEVVGAGRVVGDKKNICAHNGDLYICVRRDYWGKGVSKVILDKIVEKAKKKTKLKNLISIINIENAVTIESYEYMGFKKIGVYRNYYKIGRQFSHGIILVLNI